MALYRSSGGPLSLEPPLPFSCRPGQSASKPPGAGWSTVLWSASSWPSCVAARSTHTLPPQERVTLLEVGLSIRWSRCDHRVGILSGSEPTYQPLAHRMEFWRRTGRLPGLSRVPPPARRLYAVQLHRVTGHRHLRDRRAHSEQSVRRRVSCPSRPSRMIPPARPAEAHQARHSRCSEVRPDAPPPVLDADAARPDDGPGA